MAESVELRSNEADPPTFRWERPGDALVGSPFLLRLGDLTLVLDTARPGHVVEATFRAGDGAWSELGLQGAEAPLLERQSDGSLVVQLPESGLLAALAAAVEECERNGLGNTSWAAGEALVLLRRCGLDLSGSDTEDELIAGFASAFELLPGSVLERVRRFAAGDWLDAVRAAVLDSEASAGGLIDDIERFVHSSRDSRLPRAFAAESTDAADAASSRADIQVRSGGVVDVTWVVSDTCVEVTVVADPILGSPNPLWIQIVTPRDGDLEVSEPVQHSIQSGVSVAEIGATEGLDASSWIRVSDRVPEQDIGWFSEYLASMSRITVAQQLMRRANAFYLLEDSGDAASTLQALREAAKRAATSAWNLAPESRRRQIGEAWSSLAAQTVPLHELLAAAWTLELPELTKLPRRSITAALAVGPLIHSATAEARLYQAAAEIDRESPLLARLATEAGERAASLASPSREIDQAAEEPRG